MIGFWHDKKVGEGAAATLQILRTAEALAASQQWSVAVRLGRGSPATPQRIAKLYGFTPPREMTLHRRLPRDVTRRGAVVYRGYAGARQLLRSGHGLRLLEVHRVSWPENPERPPGDKVSRIDRRRWQTQRRAAMAADGLIALTPAVQADLCAAEPALAGKPWLVLPSGVTAGTEGGLSAMVTYMVIYLVMTLGTFACILAMRRQEGMAENISDLAGLSQTQRGLAWAFTFLFVSLAGIPIFIGFFAKFFVFMAAVEAELWWLLVVGVVTSVIATYYYLSVIKTIWFDEPQERFVTDSGPAVTITALGAAAVTVLGIIFLIGPLTRLSAIAAAPLF